MMDNIRHLHENGKSQRDIANELGCSQSQVHRLMKRHGIQVRSLAEAQALRFADPSKAAASGKQRPNYKHGRRARPHRSKYYRALIDVTACEECNQTEKVNHVHHKNGNHQDHTLCNLQVLCNSCHAKAHGLGTLIRPSYPND